MSQIQSCKLILANNYNNDGCGDSSDDNNREYFTKGGLRYVRPYDYEYKVNCKGRWLGKKLIDVMMEEFLPRRSRQYYERAFQSGRISINDSVVDDPDLVLLKVQTVIKHRVKRKELPVRDEPIEVIAVTPDMIVVNKPASLPSHPAGCYYKNSLTYIIEHHFKPKLVGKVSCINRLDRMTSGIVILARSGGDGSTTGGSTNTHATRRLIEKMQSGRICKYYLARVHGHLTPTPADINSINGGIIEVTQAIITRRQNSSHSDYGIARQLAPTPASSVADQQPQPQPQPQLQPQQQQQQQQKCEAGDDKVEDTSRITCSDGCGGGGGGGDHNTCKESRSVFELVAYDPKTDTSLVLCRPLTGRTHQLRLHLQWLGHPIVNDPLYNCYSSNINPNNHNHNHNHSNYENNKDCNDNENAVAEEAEAEEGEEFQDPEKEARLMHPDPDSLYLFLHAWAYEYRPPPPPPNTPPPTTTPPTPSLQATAETTSGDGEQGWRFMTMTLPPWALCDFDAEAVMQHLLSTARSDSSF